MALEEPVTKEAATYQDVIDAPESMVAEIIDGTLYLHPRPLPRHSVASIALGSVVHRPFQRGIDGPGGWIFMDEPELHLGGHVVVPDIAGWRRERLPKIPDEVGIETPPDWVCEVLSPSTRSLDLTRKRRIYGAHGVGHLWFVDPAARTLEAFASGEAGWTLLGAWREAEEVRSAPFDAVGFGLDVLWVE
ncbi:Uma2 family endonuclease [Acuticoccus sp.]|uniref:Uma2 family endonuclease n=1 Tax=Acuticoccus sp. TaxID=1904378 RepID=UPI003B52809C